MNTKKIFLALCIIAHATMVYSMETQSTQDSAMLSRGPLRTFAATAHYPDTDHSKPGDYNAVENSVSINYKSLLLLTLEAHKQAERSSNQAPLQEFLSKIRNRMICLHDPIERNFTTVISKRDFYHRLLPYIECTGAKTKQHTFSDKAKGILLHKHTIFIKDRLALLVHKKQSGQQTHYDHCSIEDFSSPISYEQSIGAIPLETCEQELKALLDKPQ
jgi:hypothetical protein